MLTCLISCLWICLAQIYMFVCTSYAHMPISESSHACMLGFMFYHVYVLNFYMFTCMFLCLYAYIYASTCSCVWIYSLHVSCYFPCAYALYAMFACLDLGYVCHAMCYCSLFVALSFFLVFCPIGLNPIQTLWSSSLFVHLGPYQRVWITQFACLCLLAFVLYVCVSLSGSRLYHVWSPPRA